MLADLVCIAFAGVAGVISTWVLKDHQRRRQEAAGRGALFEVPAKVRLLSHTGPEGRWREGVLYWDGDRAMFRPRFPRPGPRLDLSGTKITGSRVALPTERWWFSGQTVLLANGPLGPLEIAGSGDEQVELARVFVDRASRTVAVAAWYADPVGRHEERFWDGTDWTERVKDSDRESVDSLSAET